MFFKLADTIYTTDAIASLDKLKKPIKDKHGGADLTHVLTFKPWFIRHEALLRGKFIPAADGKRIEVILLKSYCCTCSEDQEVDK